MIRKAYAKFVEDGQNGLQQVTFRDVTAFCHRQMGKDFKFYCIFIQYFVYERSVYLGFASQR